MGARANAVRRCSWLCMTLVASTIYVALRWVKARRAEVDAGMAPGIGLGGIHLVRPQQSPMTQPLAHRRLGDRPPNVVLLHGLGASAAIWQAVAEQLAARGHSILLPDLLGFGKSRHLGTTFALADHVDALKRLLQHTEAQQPLLVGHSFGCAVAATLADEYPDAVRALVLVSPPVFRDADIARSRLSERGWLARQFILGTPAASLVCQTMCLTRPLFARLTVRLAHDVPDAVARDSVEHTWPAYRDALSTCSRTTRSLMRSTSRDDQRSSSSARTTRRRRPRTYWSIHTSTSASRYGHPTTSYPCARPTASPPSSTQSCCRRRAYSPTTTPPGRLERPNGDKR